MSLVDDVIEAHGGLDRWERAAAITVELASGGLAFATKGQGTALRRVTATVATTGQRVDLETPAGRYGFDADTPRPRGVRWSDDEIAAFAATALWTYLSLPFVLPQFNVSEDGNRLIVDFPPHVRTHSPRQVLHIDDNGLISRHDYTARDFGGWARAIQEVSEYRCFDGFQVATRRRVRPQFWPHRPELVWIDISSATAVPARGSASSSS